MNERLIAFLQILFARPNYDRNGDISSLIPAEISDDLDEVLTATSKVTEQARLISDNIKVLSDDITKERTYLSRSTNFPFLSSTVITYAIQAHYHSESIDVDSDSLKKSFSILSLLAPPRIRSEEYNLYVSSTERVPDTKIPFTALAHSEHQPVKYTMTTVKQKPICTEIFLSSESNANIW